MTPTYQGELPFDSVITVDLDPLPTQSSFHNINATFFLSRDGKTVRLEVDGDDG